MSFLFGQFIGFLGGIGACWAFWRYLLVVKPKVRVAEHAAYCEANGYLGVKIANRGKRQVTYIEVRMAVADRAAEGRITIRLAGKLNTSTLFALEPEHKIDVPWTLPTAFVFSASNGIDIMKCLKERPPSGAERRLLLTLNMRDGYSGTQLVELSAFSPEAVINGWYDPKLSLNVNPLRVCDPSLDTTYVTIG